ncbi:Arginine utilization regulatory protein RocR [Thermovenabulum gondwanense]|uniref:Arginine utilization regulatory protein RocR n=1 Tax=Thermovenabulum gondwanense TaxID=520767 RepID=A0A162M6S2_9FIRM|nr:Arginine utilization regulatory protein RocR [Thermovenabulum gondwanense]
MKKVVLVSQGENTSRMLTNQLKDIIGDLITIEAYSMEKGIPKDLKADIILLTHYTLLEDLDINFDGKVMLAKRSINYKYLDLILQLSSDLPVLLVNDTKITAEETVFQIKELGINHINFIPYYPGAKEFPEAEIAVTPGETKYVPNYIKKVVDIGCRLIDLTTMVDILRELDLMEDRASYLSARYIRELVELNKNLISARDDVINSKKQIEAILDLVNDPIFALDEDKKIIFANNQARKILKKLDVEKILNTGMGNNIVSFNGEKMIMTQVALGKSSVIHLRYASDIAEMEEKLRMEAKEKGFFTKYTFNHIVGKSTAILKAIEKAKKIASSDSNVLIYGETGTGKEIFAQAIHSASKRSKFPFIAINCSALPANLLESELFGYEEGAFTGAKKGGKQGIFEMANRGTVFLDEISEIPVEIQARLLRVLQEKEVMRIGGYRMVPVDVRIIAATNKDPVKLVKENKFREDLFYRLTPLFLFLPPLRERVEDVPLLFDYFIDQIRSVPPWRWKDLSEEVKNILLDYSWPGNVREIKNCVEYLLTMAAGIPKVYDLPDIICLKDGENKDSFLREPKIDELLINVLEIIRQGEVKGIKLGRNSIARLMSERGFNVTPSKVRKLLQDLKEKGYLISGRGRQGTALTPQGRAVIGGK